MSPCPFCQRVSGGEGVGGVRSWDSPCQPRTSSAQRREMTLSIMAAEDTISVAQLLMPEYDAFVSYSRRHRGERELLTIESVLLGSRLTAHCRDSLVMIESAGCQCLQRRCAGRLRARAAIRLCGVRLGTPFGHRGMGRAHDRERQGKCSGDIATWKVSFPARGRSGRATPLGAARTSRDGSPSTFGYSWTVHGEASFVAASSGQLIGIASKMLGYALVKREGRLLHLPPHRRKQHRANRPQSR